MRKKILALVLARKGSSRLKNKNLLILKDKPLIEWTFKKLNKKNIRKLFVDILISTNSQKILNLSKKYNFLSPWLRPKIYSTKFSTSEASALHALKWYEKNIQKVDGIFLFQPTTPFRMDNKITLAVKIFLKYNKQIVSVCSKNTYKFDKNSINGSFYLSPVSILKKFKSFRKKGFIPLKMSTSLENIDIDTKVDFDLAIKLLNNK
jgi:CMP-N,N'-diacetyllegionaminic acid synthase